MKEDKKLKSLEFSESSEDKEIEVVEAPVEEPAPAPEPVQYIHVDQFLQTAVPLFGLNRMQARGFKTHMFGRLYQKSMDAFVTELENYLGKKLR